MPRYRAALSVGSQSGSSARTVHSLTRESSTVPRVELERDQALRLECLKLAVALHSRDADPQPGTVMQVFDSFVQYVLGGMDGGGPASPSAA